MKMRFHASGLSRALLGLVGVLPVLGAVAVAAPAPVGAQTVQGRVFDPGDGTPLSGVRLRLLDADDRPVATSLSDDTGHFHITTPAPGTWRLAADLLGYGGAVSDTLTLAEDQTVTVEVRMAVDPVRIEEPIVVVAERPALSPDIEDFHRRRQRGEKTGIGHFLHGEEIERRMAGSPSDLLRMVPGVRIAPGSRGGGQIIRMRGGCLPAIYIDGSRINQFTRGESLDDYVAVQSIEGIEVYQGPQQPSGRFHDRSGCGLVLVWTRRGEYDSSAPFSWTRLLVGLSLFAVLFLLR